MSEKMRIFSAQLKDKYQLTLAGSFKEFDLAGPTVTSEQKKMEEKPGFGNSGKRSNFLLWGDILTRIFFG